MILAQDRLLIGRYVVAMSVDRLGARGDQWLGVASRDGYHNGVAGIAAVMLRAGTSPGLLHAHAAAEEFLMEVLWRQPSRLVGASHLAAVALTTTGLSWLVRGGIGAWLERGTYRLRLERRCTNIPLQSGDCVSLGSPPRDDVPGLPLHGPRLSLSIAERLLRRRALRAR